MFGWNDPAGTMLAKHGFAFHDRQTTLFGRVGAAQPDPQASKKEVFHEMDDRPGFYLGAQVRYLDRAVLNLLHYDNRADPTVESAQLQDFAWRTGFDAAALRIETAGQWTVLLQAMDGNTVIAPSRWLTWEFDSQSAMLARRWQSHLFALRYDAFEVEFQNRPAASGSEHGHAWALSWSFEPGERWRFALEWLRVESEVPARTEDLGEPPFAAESQLEFSARYRLHGRF
jgi:hypothetical protein